MTSASLDSPLHLFADPASANLSSPELQPPPQRRYWSGRAISALAPDEVFVFGSNPEGRHGAGAAKAALAFGARYRQGRGLAGQSYALPTKNLSAGFVEPSTGIAYSKAGERSLSPEQIRANVDELYALAARRPDLSFLVSYQFDTLPDGRPKKSLNGYDAAETFSFFLRDDIPANVVFHETYRQRLEPALLLGAAPRSSHTAPSLASSTTSPALPSTPSAPADADLGPFLFFRSSHPCSQWHPALFSFRGHDFISCEQFMMFSKARLFGDLRVANLVENPELNFPEGSSERAAIAACRDPARGSASVLSDPALHAAWDRVQRAIKDLGRQVAAFDPAVWDAKKLNIVRVANREKFSQNPDLAAFLLSSGTRIIAEASPYDRIWGIGLPADHPDAQFPSKWRGLNLLGQALSEVRDLLSAPRPRAPSP